VTRREEITSDNRKVIAVARNRLLVMVLAGVASLAGLTVFGLGHVARAEPVGWRGDGSGRYPDAKPTLNWGKDRNVIWKTPMPAESNATPVVYGERIFVTSEPATLICLNKADGKILWKKSSTLEECLPPDKLAKMRLATKAKAQLQSVNAKLGGLRGEISKLAKADQNDGSELARLKDKEAELKSRVEQIQKGLEPISKYTRPKAAPQIGYSTPTPVTDGKCV